MATFQKRGRKWRALVRKKGYRPRSETFTTKAAAERWARQVEKRIEARDFADPADLETTPVGSLIDDYIEEFSPTGTKLGSLNILKAGLGMYSLAELDSPHILAHCRRRGSTTALHRPLWRRTWATVPRSCAGRWVKSALP